MKIDPYRLLSFAFASADLFMEVGDDGAVKFALGAAQKVCGRPESDLLGGSWRDVVASPDHFMVEAMLASLGQAERRGPVSVRVARPRSRVPLCWVRKLPRRPSSVPAILSIAT